MHLIQDVNNLPVLLSVEHLKIKHDEQYLVEDLSFKLHEGERKSFIQKL